MHKESHEWMREQARQLTVSSVLDVGSCDVNGTYRDLFASTQYVGIDLRAGKHVDVRAAWRFPFRYNAFDLVISGQCLEHDRYFWRTVAEMGRVARKWVAIVAPLKWHYHEFPGDYWRFQLDAPSVWAELTGMELMSVSEEKVDRNCSDLRALFASKHA